MMRMAFVENRDTPQKQDMSGPVDTKAGKVMTARWRAKFVEKSNYLLNRPALLAPPIK